MKLTVDSDTVVLILSKARSRIAGYFRLLDPPLQELNHSHNGAILIECRKVRSVVTSAVEAETHGVFYNIQTALHLRHILIEMGHPQEPIPIQIDNSTT